MPNDQQPSALPPGIDVEYWFSAHETAELAVEVEEKGSTFYRRLAAETDSETVRAIRAWLWPHCLL